MISHVRFLFIAALFWAFSCHAHDHIIFKDGTEKDIKLSTINDAKIVYQILGDKTTGQQEAPIKDVYMIYVEKQGNIYITPDGKRVTGEAKRADTKHNDVVYLVRGAEIEVDNVQSSADNIEYVVKSKSSGIKGLMGARDVAKTSLNRSEVFMIRYKSGLIDVVTPFEPAKKTDVNQEVSENEDENSKPHQFVVVFHTTKKKETHNSIAEQYGVTPQQIIEWNELPERTKPSTPLKVKTQLMIYQPK